MLGKGAKTTDLWIQEFEPVSCCKVDEHREEHEDEHENNCIGNEILESYVLREEQKHGPGEDYVARWEAEELMKNNMKTVIELAMTRTVTETMEETIEDGIHSRLR